MKLILSNGRYSLFFLLLAVTGCTSFSSTPMTRWDDGTFSGDSNGKRSFFCASKPYKGIPVRVKLQTHVDVWIDEEYCLATDGSAPVDNLRFMKVRQEPVTTEQVIIVDFKRPAAGTGDFKLKFSEEQYFSNIDSHVIDKTIEQSTALVATVLKAASTANESGQPAVKETPQFEWKVRTVAYQRFDLSNPNYEAELDEFVSHHLNNCNQCSGSPTYDQPR